MSSQIILVRRATLRRLPSTTQAQSVKGVFTSPGNCRVETVPRTQTDQWRRIVRNRAWMVRCAWQLPQPYRRSV